MSGRTVNVGIRRELHVALWDVGKALGYTNRQAFYNAILTEYLGRGKAPAIAVRERATGELVLALRGLADALAEDSE